MPRQLADTALARQRAIVQIIRKHKVANQQVLQRHLKKAGHTVTQATLSRDLDAVGARKSGTGRARKYVIEKPSTEAGATLPPLGRLLLEVDHAGNLVVAKTPPGGAQLLAAEVDKRDLREIVGTVAGDDSVLIVTRTPALAKKFAKDIIKLANQPSRR